MGFSAVSTSGWLSGGLTPSLDTPRLTTYKVQVQGLKTNKKLILFSLRLGLVKPWAKHLLQIPSAVCFGICALDTRPKWCLDAHKEVRLLRLGF